MSSLSSNEKSGDALSRATYYSSQQQQHHQQQQLEYQMHQQQLHLQHQIQQQQLQQNNQNLSYNNINTNISSNNQRSYSNNQHQNHYQHQPLSNIFPSIYNDASNYMSNAQLGLMSSSSNSSTPTSVSSNPNILNHHSTAPYSSVQRQIQQDWSNREYIQVILSNIKKLTDFLNSFELSCRSKMAVLDEKLTKLEKQIDFVEARVTKGDTLN